MIECFKLMPREALSKLLQVLGERKGCWLMYLGADSTLVVEGGNATAHGKESVCVNTFE